MKRSDEKFHSAEVIQWVNGNRKEPDQALVVQGVRFEAK